MTAGDRLPRTGRLRSAAELRRTVERGRRRRLAHLDVIWMDNSAGHPRLGLIVPKFQATAVARNRLRRRLREIWRRELRMALPACDMVIRARRDAYAARFEALREELVAWRGEAAP
ncbi:MAG: ribonuclease P protein component [Gemmatimonadales bacterium]